MATTESGACMLRTVRRAAAPRLGRGAPPSITPCTREHVKHSYKQSHRTLWDTVEAFTLTCLAFLGTALRAAL